MMGDRGRLEDAVCGVWWDGARLGEEEEKEERKCRPDKGQPGDGNDTMAALWVPF